MRDLIQQERFEIEVLDALNSQRLLRYFVFGGGTMLRLCYGLNRYSVDLDFWMVRQVDHTEVFQELKDCLSEPYRLQDAANKFYTMLFEIKSSAYPRSLKIEIRKEQKKIKVESAVAYSRYADRQVFLKAVSLQDMMMAKVEAFLDRKEIRDVFDVEFLFKRGVPLPDSPEVLTSLLRGLDALSPKDYTVKLGQLLEAAERKYYTTEKFKLLRSAVQEKINSSP